MSLSYTDSKSNYWVIDSYGQLDYVKNSSDYSYTYDSGAILTFKVASSTYDQSFSYSGATGSTNTHTVTGTNSTYNLEVTRKAYIGDGFARFHESFTNTGTSTQTFTIKVRDDFHYNSDVVEKTSSGDTTFNKNDDWYITGDSYYTSYSKGIHVINGVDVNPTNAAPDYYGGYAEFTITLKGGETKALMHFFAKADNLASSTTLANNINKLSQNKYLTGLSTAELSQVQNFNFDKTSSTSYTLKSYEQNLTLTGSANINGTGNNKDNTIIGNSGKNTLNGKGGDDILDGKGGADTLIGGTGNDTFIVDNVNDKVVEYLNQGVDTIKSSVSYNIASKAHLENITLTGNKAINATGNNSNNILTGNSNNNKLIGKGGNDTYIVQNSGDKVTELANQGIDTVQSSVNYTLGANVEKLILTGNKAINGTGNGLANTITGNDKANTLSGKGGNDTYIVQNSEDKVVELAGQGTDTVKSSVSFTIGNNIEKLQLTGSNSINGTGNNQANTLIGNSGNNVLDGKGGVDKMSGGAGNDTYIVDNAKDVVTEGLNKGIDTIQTSLNNYTLKNNVENGVLTGNGAYTMRGNSLDNDITGNGSNNKLYGNNGDDVLRGGGGNDTLYGGDGDDYLIGDNGHADNQIKTVTKKVDGKDVSFNITIPESATGKIHVEGLISQIDFTEQLNVVYIIDKSGSMSSQFLGETNVGDQNADGSSNTVLDAAIASFKKLNSSFVDSGLGSNVNVALIPFESTASVTYKGKANADTNLDGTADIIESLVTIDDGGGTGFTEALTAAKDHLESAGGGRNIIYFASDGSPNNTSYLTSVLPALRKVGDSGTKIIAIGMGSGADEETLDILDDNKSNDSAEIVTNPEDLEATLVETSVLRLVEAAWVEIYRDGQIVDLIGSDQFEITPLGVKFKSTDIKLASSGSDNIQAKLVLADNNGTTLTTGATVSIKPFVSNDTLYGGAGNDTLDGGIGADTMYGGTGDDKYIVDNKNDKVIEYSGQGTDTVESSFTYTISNSNVENLTLTGEKNLNGTGNSGNNTLIGNSGNNILNGKAGTDKMDGGKGNDKYYLEDTTDVIVEKQDTTDDLYGTDTVITKFNTTLYDSYSTNSTYSSYYSNTATVYNVENATLSSTATGTSLTGSTKDNILIGNNKNNTIMGKEGDDRLVGNGGTDTLLGGAGNDTYVVKSKLDKVYETTTTTSTSDAGGIDTVESTISYTLGTNLENLKLLGSAHLKGTGNGAANEIMGNNGNNIIDGKGGKDTMKGGKGNDTYFINTVYDKVIESANQGIDTVNANKGYKLSAHVENLNLTGTKNIAGAGNWSNNKLTGNDGNNYLFGYRGNDTLIGGKGNDKLFGGHGKDSFVFNKAANSNTNKDTILDFSAKDDTIKLDNAIFGKLGSNGKLNKAFFKDVGTGSKDANDYVVYNSKTGVLSYDSNGSAAGGSVDIAVLGNKAKLTADDFVVI